MENVRPEEEVERRLQEARRSSRAERSRNTRNRAIWSAKCEEFPRVVRALSVTSIDMTSIYISSLREVWLDWECGD